MIPQKIKTIIASCKNHNAIDVCSQLIEYIMEGQNQTEALALLQQQRNKVGFTKDDIDRIQGMED